METKSKTKKLELIDKPIPTFTTDNAQNFKGAYPPTRKDICLQFYGYHEYLQRASKRQSSVMDAVKLAMVENWNYNEKC